MSRLRMVLFVVIGILATSMTAFAQATAEVGDNAASVNKYRALAAGVGFAIAVVGVRSDSRALVLRRAKARRVTRALLVESRR